MSARDRRVEKAQMRVLFQVPFFAPGVVKLPVEFTDDPKVPTACTDGGKIVWNGKWFDKLKDEEIVTVLCHEVSHCMLGHLWRAPAAAKVDADSWNKWNQATDHAVNLMLKEFSAEVMQRRLADPFPFPDPQDAYCADPAYQGMAEEQIFARMPKQPKGPKGGKPGNQPGSMPSFGQFSQPSNQPGSQPAQGSGQGQATGQAAGPAQPGQNLQNSWEATLIQSVKIAAKSQGKVPAGLERYVGELINPKVPWTELVRQWLREQAADDWDWMKPNTYFDESDFILPSLNSERMGPIVFATDTSGSITDEILKKFRTEKQSCLDDLKPAKLVDIYCDAKIHLVKEYTVGDTIGEKAPGGGGTDFRPVFEHADTLTQTPKCLVYLTDLMGTFPEKEPPYPVLWVCWDQGQKAPWGETVYAD